jgi:hypothetical protein
MDLNRDKLQEGGMIARIGVTLAALLIAAIAFLGGGPTDAGPANPFGILFVLLAILLWFGWEEICAGFSTAWSGGDGPNLPLLARFGPVFITGILTNLKRQARPRRDGSDSAEG